MKSYGAGGRRPSSICNSCERAQADKAKSDHLAALAALPLEERLARIEAWIYDHAQVRHGYIEPPRF